MSDPFFDSFIADLIKGAAASEGFVRGGRVNVQVARDVSGHAEKLASLGSEAATGMGRVLGLMAQHPTAARAAIGSGIGALSGAASAEEGHRLEGAGKGALVGGGLGLAVPAGMQALTRAHPMAVAAGALPGAMSALGKMGTHYAGGAKAAAAAFGVKEAFLGALAPMIGAVAGPMAARAGVGALAGGAGGKMLGGIAGKIAPRIAGGIGGAAFDMGAQVAGQHVAQKVAPPPQM